jgi:hypothetical protein
MSSAATYLAEKEDRLAWIMGSSRSGSTWLLGMLSELSRVVPIDDPHIGHHLGVWRPLPIAWAASAERPTLTTLDTVKREKPDYFFSDRYRDAWLPALRELILARFGAQLDDARGELGSEPVVVVKEPGSHAAEMLIDAFPGSRMIFLLRDGRDVVDSWLDAYRGGSWAIDEGAFAVAPHGRLALVEWLSAVWSYRTRTVAAALARFPPERRILLRYERLLENPARELARICSVLELDASPAELARIGGEHSYERVDPDHRGPLQEVRTAEPGGWRRNLSATERQAMYDIMGAELTAFGYLPDVRDAAA